MVGAVILRFFLLCCAIDYVCLSLITFPPNKVMEFIKTQDYSKENCSMALDKMTQYNESDEKSDFLTSSFALGLTSDYSHREHSKWMYKGLQCINSVPKDQLSIRDYCFVHINNGITASVCMPRACKRHRPTFLVDLSRYGNFTHVSTRIKTSGEIQCMPSRWKKQWYEKPLPLIDLILQILLILLALAATVYGFYRQKHSPMEPLPKNNLKKFILCFSIKTNLQRLFRVPSDPKSTVTCIFGLRFMATVWTLIGHSYMALQIFLSNSDPFITDLKNSFLAQIITNFTLSVDVFFVISGTLTTYSWFRRIGKNDPESSWYSWTYWLKFYRHRLIRLWPAYANILWVTVSRLSYTHHHPLWPVIDPTIQCRTRWWQNLLFLNSLFPDGCLAWHWYLGTEFIFYLIIPIFLLGLRYNRVFGILLILTVTVLSTALRAALIAAYNFPPTQFLWGTPEIFNPDVYGHHTIVYIKPYTRIGPYLIGVLLGYMLCHIKKIETFSISPFKQSVGWTLCILGLLWPLFGLYPALQGWSWPVYHLIYGSIHRTIFAIALSWLIFACYTGYGGVVNIILSSKWIVPFANLSYGSYLFHLIPIVAFYLWLAFPITWQSHWQGMFYVLVQLIFSYSAALFICCLYELPPLNMEAIFLLKRPVSKSSNLEVYKRDKAITQTQTSKLTQV